MKCHNCNNIISDQFMFCPHCGTNVNLDLANATEEAIYWYNKAQAGDADALNKVGIYYYQGKEGFPIDFEKAIKYFEKGAGKGSVSASYNLAICYYKGHGVEINKPYAKTLLNYAKDNGHDGAAKALFKIEQEEHAEKLRIEEELRRQREKEEQERRRKELEAYNERRRVEEEKRRQEQLRLEAERQKEEAERINAFIRDAIDFYCSWLEKEQSERFLTPALESVISAKIRDSEERINRNLFKIAVDLSILAKIVLDEDGGGYDEDYLADLRRDSIREVSETNGAIRMEQRFK